MCSLFISSHGLGPAELRLEWGRGQVSLRPDGPTRPPRPIALSRYAPLSPGRLWVRAGGTNLQLTLTLQVKVTEWLDSNPTDQTLTLLYSGSWPPILPKPFYLPQCSCSSLGSHSSSRPATCLPGWHWQSQLFSPSSPCLTGASLIDTKPSKPHLHLKKFQHKILSNYFLHCFLQRIQSIAPTSHYLKAVDIWCIGKYSSDMWARSSDLAVQAAWCPCSQSWLSTALFSTSWTCPATTPAPPQPPFLRRGPWQCWRGQSGRAPAGG